MPILGYDFNADFSDDFATMSARENAVNALLAAVTAAYQWSNTPARRLKLWGDVPKAARPALFQSESGRESYAWTNLTNPKRSVEVRLFVYVAATDANPGAPQLNAIKDALDAALKPSGSDVPLGRNTLGGNVSSCKIRDIPVNDPGDIDGDGVLVVTVELVLP